MTALIIPPIEIKSWQPTTVQKVRVVDLDCDGRTIRISTVYRVGGFETMVAEVYEDASGFEVLDELELEGHRDMITAIMWHSEAVRRYTAQG